MVNGFKKNQLLLKQKTCDPEFSLTKISFFFFIDELVFFPFPFVVAFVQELFIFFLLFILDLICMLILCKLYHTFFYYFLPSFFLFLLLLLLFSLLLLHFNVNLSSIFCLNCKIFSFPFFYFHLTNILIRTNFIIYFGLIKFQLVSFRSLSFLLFWRGN